MNANTLPASSYMERNGRWLRPLLAAVVLLVGPLVASGMPEMTLPDWLPLVGFAGAFIGVLLCGIFAALTDTLSAKIVRYVALFLSASLALSWIFGLLF